MTSKFPIVAGILQIAVAFTILFLSRPLVYVPLEPNAEVSDFIMDFVIVFDFFGLLTFVSGLAGGLFAIMREYFYITIFGALLSLCCGLLYEWFTNLVLKAYATLFSEVVIGTITVLFPILILVFLLPSRTKFR